MKGSSPVYFTIAVIFWAVGVIFTDMLIFAKVSDAATWYMYSVIGVTALVLAGVFVILDVTTIRRCGK